MAPAPMCRRPSHLKVTRYQGARQAHTPLASVVAMTIFALVGLQAVAVASEYAMPQATGKAQPRLTNTFERTRGKNDCGKDMPDRPRGQEAQYVCRGVGTTVPERYSRRAVNGNNHHPEQQSDRA
jgi:hypothetical protein